MPLAENIIYVIAPCWWSVHRRRLSPHPLGQEVAADRTTAVNSQQSIRSDGRQRAWVEMTMLCAECPNLQFMVVG